MSRMSRERAIAIATQADHQIATPRADICEAARVLAEWVEEFQAHGAQSERGSWLDAHGGAA